MPIYSVELNGAPIDIEAPTPEDAARRAAPTVGGNACPNTPVPKLLGLGSRSAPSAGRATAEAKTPAVRAVVDVPPDSGQPASAITTVSASPAQRGAVGRPPPGGESRPARRAGAQDLGPRWNSGNRG
jgi:hypothetical protein